MFAGQEETCLIFLIFFLAPKPNLDVNNLLGKLMASGLIGTVPASSGTPIASAEDRDENVPEMPFRIEELKKYLFFLIPYSSIKIFASKYFTLDCFLCDM